MEYLTSSEAAKIWGISSRRVTLLCNEGRVEGGCKKRTYVVDSKKGEETRRH